MKYYIVCERFRNMMCKTCGMCLNNHNVYPLCEKMPPH